MLKKLFAYVQYLLPQHSLSNLIGALAESRNPRVKNTFIGLFLKLYNINLQEAASSDFNDYPTFNSFFTRHLKEGIRPIAGELEIASPADGTIAQLAYANDYHLLQAKGFYFDLTSLLAGDAPLAKQFKDGPYATIYLAPYDYHRFHMPLRGRVKQVTYVPGKLFSVNRATSQAIHRLYSQNERIIIEFETEAGPMCLILVGAMIVGSIKLAWMEQPIKGKHIQSIPYPDGLTLEKGAELGYFKMGSTVLMLFAKNRVRWSTLLEARDHVKFGQSLGMMCKNEPNPTGSF